MLGIPVATIRTWEDRYGLVVPERNASGHRLYRRDQVEQLKFVRASIAAGMSAADAHRLLAEQAGSALRPRARAGGSRLLILLADHDPYAAEYEEYFLKTEGFEVDVTRPAGEARKSFDEYSPSVAVVELLISGGAGLGLCQRFKERGDALVIAVSALEARDRAIEAGADAFLLKPLEPLQLVSAVRDLLGESAFLRPGPEAAR
jgi:DNA-binding transcriptional MerR regulator